MPSHTDAIEMLKEDHEQVRKLLDQLVRAKGGNRRQELLPKVERLILAHSRLEEELFYPAYDKATQTKEGHIKVLEAKEEHGLAEQVLEELNEEEWDSPEFQAKAQVLKELVEHHVEEEENEMLPKAKQAMSKRRLESLSEQMVARKERLMEEIEEEIQAR